MRRHSRIIGVVYLLMFLTSILSQVLLGNLVVGNNAAATAAHILAHEPRFRLGIAFGLVDTALYLALAGLFYGLFKPVSRSLSLVAAFFGVAGCTIQGGGSTFALYSLVVLGGGPTLNAFKGDLPAFALTLLNLNDQAVIVALVFFAVYCFLIGCLILGSSFLPRFLGVLMVLAGLGWLTFLYAPLADHLSPYIQVLGIVAEGLLMLWLLIMGVNEERWHQQADAVHS